MCHDVCWSRLLIQSQLLLYCEFSLRLPFLLNQNVYVAVVYFDRRLVNTVKFLLVCLFFFSFFGKKFKSRRIEISFESKLLCNFVRKISRWIDVDLI